MQPITIYRPMRTNRKTQGFGENKAFVKLDDYGVVIRPFIVVGTWDGVNPDIDRYAAFYKAIGMEGHNGEDWQLWNGEGLYFNVYAKNITWKAYNHIDKDGGIGVDVKADQYIYFETFPEGIFLGKTFANSRKEWEENNHMLRLKFRYWHLKKSLVYDGQAVVLGQLFAQGGNTGASSGPHLHTAPKVIEKSGFTVDGDNGYTGGQDLSEFFVNEFVLDHLKKREALQRRVISLAHQTIYLLTKIISLQK